VHAVESTNNVVHADAGSVVLYGVSDLVVVTREGLTLVTTKDRAAELKQLLDALPASVRERT
jgi:mannose-1-phosphate guanylyltransferase